MVRKFGSRPPSGGATLHEAAFALTNVELRESYKRAKSAWEAAGKPTSVRGVKHVRSFIGGGRLFEMTRDHPAFAAYDSAHRTLMHEVRRMLRSGELQGVALELGAIDAEYHEVAAEHWKALKVAHWQESMVRRKAEKSALFKVLVYPRDAYDRLVAQADAGVAREPSPRRASRRQSRKDCIIEIWEAAPPM
jgi:hypothetical protein